MTLRLPFSLPASEDEIVAKRAEILCRLCDNDAGFADIPVRGVKQSTLDLMLRLYDDLFFGGYLMGTYVTLRVTVSTRLLSAAGKFIHHRGAKRLEGAEIRMSGDFLMRLEYGPFHLNGLQASVPQEAFLIVFEHELCHALQTALTGSTDHGVQYQTLVRRLFGHTAVTHSLPTRKQEAAKQGLRIGMTVTFPYHGQTLTGRVSYLGKSASVMVPNIRGEYRDNAGRRYSKFRVPIDQITPT